MLRSREEKFVEECRRSPVFFARHVLGVDPYDLQVEIMEAIPKFRKVVVRSGHAIGKSFLSALIAVWFLVTKPDSIVITTAPVDRQVRKILWAEIRSLMARAKRRGVDFEAEVLQQEIRISDTHFAIGFTAKDATQFQGFHAKGGWIIVIADEAPGIEEHIWPAIYGVTTNVNSHILAIGNPTSSTGRFYDISTDPALGWKPFQLSSADSPNVREGRVVIPGLCTLDWIEERKREWGEDSNLYRTRVLGEFPDEGEDTLIRLSVIQKAVYADFEPTGVIRLGVDVARYGSDLSVMLMRRGRTVTEIESWGKTDTMYTAHRVFEKIRDTEGLDPRNVWIDDSGLGGGVVDYLQREKGMMVRGVGFGTKATLNDQFADWKSETFWQLRREFERGEISIPDNPRLIKDLSSLRIARFARDGRIRLMSKEDMRREGLKSPDFADALVLASRREVGVIERAEELDPDKIIAEYQQKKLQPQEIMRRRKKSALRGLRLA